MNGEGFLLTWNEVDNNGKACIDIWLKTANGHCKLEINNERPLCFVFQDQKLQVHYCLKLLEHYYEYKPLELKHFNQSAVAALYFDTLAHFREGLDTLKKSGIYCFEADIRMSDRYLMERFIYGSLAFNGTRASPSGLDHPTPVKPFACYTDVKTRPAAFKPVFSIISLDVECSMQGELYSIGFYGEKIKKVIMIGEPDNPGGDRQTSIDWVNDEKTLLNALVTTINVYDPDLIIGWNIVNFDWQLLIERSRLHDISLDIGRDGSAIRWRKHHNEPSQGFVHIAGRVVIDGIDALRTATYSFSSFSLEHVAQTLLGEGKKTEDVYKRVEQISHDFHHNKPKLAAYNLQDCKLVWDIFEHTRIIDFLVFRSQLTGLAMDKQGGSVAAFTQLYLPKLHRANYIAPNLPEDGGLASPGGYVMDSCPGLYNNVIVLDYKSLYPSIIRTFKIDPMGLIEGLLEMENEKNAGQMDTTNVIPGYKGAVFSREKHFLPDIIENLWALRDQAKKASDLPRSQAIKILMNSFYGVLGSGGCRFYDTRLASSITLRGHAIMQQTRAWLEKLGYQVIYGDTDSIFVKLDDSLDVQTCERIGKNLQEEINDSWNETISEEFHLDNYLELEFETHYQRFLMPTIRGSDAGSKKRYAGLVINPDTGEEEMIFKGMESARSDWTDLAHEFQQELYRQVFHNINPANYIKQTVSETLNGEKDEKLVYRKRLRKPLSEYTRNKPPHVKAALIADNENARRGQPLQYQNRGWISYVITTHGPEPLEYQHHPLDYDHYIEKQLLPIAEAILPFTGLSFEELISSQLGLF